VSREAAGPWPYPRFAAHRGAGKLAPENNGLKQLLDVLPGPVATLIACVRRNARLSEVFRVSRPQRGRQVGLAGLAAQAGLQDLFGGIADHCLISGRVSRAS